VAEQKSVEMTEGEDWRKGLQGSQTKGQGESRKREQRPTVKGGYIRLREFSRGKKVDSVFQRKTRVWTGGN